MHALLITLFVTFVAGSCISAFDNSPTINRSGLSRFLSFVINVALAVWIGHYLFS